MKRLSIYIILALFTVVSHSNATEKTHYLLNTDNGLSSDSVLQLCQLNDGRIVAYNGKSVDIYDGNDFSSISIADTMWNELPNYIGYTHLYIEHKGFLWIKEYGKVTCVDIKRMRQVSSDEIEAHIKQADDLFTDSQHRLWLLHGDTLSCENGSEIAIRHDNGQLQDIAIEDKSAFLFYTSGIMEEYDYTTDSIISHSSPFKEHLAVDYAATSLVVNDDTTLYQIKMGNKGAILNSYNKVSHHWSTLHETHQSLHTLTLVSDTSLYITTTKGYMRIDLPSLKKTYFSSVRLPDGSSLDTGINCVCVDREGAIWLGTYGSGILYLSPLNGLFDSRHIDIELTPLLSNIFINGERYKSEISCAYLNELSLPYKQGNVAFQFTSTGYVHPHKSCYKFKLHRLNDKEEPTWEYADVSTPNGLVNNRGVLYLSFVRLSPGEYTLDVLTSTDNEKWNLSNIRRFSLTILPPWWATEIAITVYIVGFLFVIMCLIYCYGLYIKRKVQRKNNEDMLLLKVKNLTEKVSLYEKQLHLILSDNNDESTDETNTTISKQDIDFMDRVTHLVEQNIGNAEYSVEQLSRDMCMERTGLYKRLTSLVDQSPVLFIRSARLKRAMTLLKEGKMTISEIAEATGFSSAGYFSKCFQKEFGNKPSDFLPHH